MSGAKLYPLMGAQQGAADPSANVWLSASAGTGKTQVLTARVFRLLLRGDVRPENILCLTYTKAGATEMANRINGQLARWVMADAGSLGADLAAIGASVSPESQSAARKLFAHMLDAPGGGLQIMTIHSFCQRLLASFPAEAGLVPGFAAMEERDAADLAQEVLADLALTAEKNGDEAMIAALQSMSLNDGEEGTERFLAKCAAEPVAMAALPRHAEDRLRWTRRLVGVEFTGSARDWLMSQVTDGAFDRRFLDAYLDYQHQWGTATAQKRIAPMTAWLAATPEVRAETLAEVQGAWMVKAGTPAKQQAKAVEAEAQDTAAMLCDWSAGLLGAVAQAAYAERLAEALRAGQAYAELYDAAKRTRGLVDFDDLVRETARLLRSPDIGPWIAYKLDQRIEHILVDESQDTNKAQWDIVDALSAEFFAGEGAHGNDLRTLFTVGDFKQAIFGFQGTSPESYLAARDAFSARADAVGRGFAGLDMADSFRSNRPILAVVDAMIDAQGSEGFGLPDAIAPHGVQREASGEVVLASPFVAAVADDEDDEGEEGWIAAPVRQYAGHLAKRIRALLDNPPWLAQKNRPMNAGDIMILLRRRGDLASLLVARLYAENVPVAGVDRLRLIEPLAVLDLLAAVRFAVQPEDDLNTATLLRSPLFGWDDDQLLAASDRPKGRSLWDAIKSDPAYADTTTHLHDLLNRADYGEPYAFLEHILSGPMQGRRALQARLGYEALDPIGELLTLAQGFATRHVASLQRFLDWMERSDTEIKREGEADAGTVRVMTVHGSKGLQAPYVILADMTTDPTKTPDRSLAFVVEDAEEPYKVPLLPVPKAAKSGRLALLAEAKQAKELQENLRLLYVAMTRAEEHLVMVGRAPSRGELPTHCWHSQVAPAFETLECDTTEHPIWGAAQVFGGEPVVGGGDVMSAAPVEPLVLPDWLHTQAPVESRPPRPLAPSKTEEDTTGESPPSAAMQAAARRGNLLHALFERLPDVEPDAREGAANRWLSRQAPDLSDAARAAIIGDALALLNDPLWADVFGAQSLAEVPVAAVVGQTVVTGQVDRLLLLPDRIVVVDFKTGRFVPGSVAEVRVPYIRQMAYYAAALSRIYPGRRVEAALLYTSGPRMVTVPDDLLAEYAPT